MWPWDRGAVLAQLLAGRLPEEQGPQVGWPRARGEEPKAGIGIAQTSLARALFFSAAASTWTRTRLDEQGQGHWGTGAAWRSGRARSVALVKRLALSALIFISPSSLEGSPFKRHVCYRRVLSTWVPSLVLFARSRWITERPGKGSGTNLASE